MKMGVRIMAVLLGLIVSHGLVAQAPAGAPAGSNGMCKDGSYSTAATKDGACRGHKGVQTWYGAATTKAAKTATAAPAPKSAAAPAPAPVATKPAATPMAAKPAPTAAPMPAPGPAQNNSTMAKGPTTKAPAAKGELAEKTAAPGGGNGLVWVNTASNVYHCQGTAYYGKTKAGAYMSESDAKAKGARADAGKPCMK